jgi:hypothetical protein
LTRHSRRKSSSASDCAPPGDVVDGLPDQLPPPGSRQSLQNGAHVPLANQPLLEAGRDDGPGLEGRPCPLRGVDQGPGSPGARRTGRKQHVAVVEHGAPVHHDAGGHAPGPARSGNQHVHDVRGVSPEVQRRQAGEAGALAGREQGGPSPVVGPDRPVVGDQDRAVHTLPAAARQPVPDGIGRQVAARLSIGDDSHADMVVVGARPPPPCGRACG